MFCCQKYFQKPAIVSFYIFFPFIHIFLKASNREGRGIMMLLYDLYSCRQHWLLQLFSFKRVILQERNGRKMFAFLKPYGASNTTEADKKRNLSKLGN